MHGSVMLSMIMIMITENTVIQTDMFRDEKFTNHIEKSVIIYLKIIVKIEIQ